ncbi:MAG: hypothetical protein ACYTHM_21240, partial [Planctomycetota bacterium]
KNMNPCIDCRIAQLRKAAGFLEGSPSGFLVTGEVLGQRPMSQRRRVMSLIEREAGLEGRIFRPLSAGVLPETLPERKGWVRRENFPAIRGRSRKPQMALAKRFQLDDVPGSGGGCLLTFPEFAAKVGDSVEHGDLSLRHGRLLKTGRHFRLPSGAKVVVGKDEKENDWLEREAGVLDGLVIPKALPGPTGLVFEGSTSKDMEIAASLCGRYMKVDPGSPVVFLGKPGGEGKAYTIQAPAWAPESALDVQVGLHRLTPKGKAKP